jgi:hypothetical protein
MELHLLEFERLEFAIGGVATLKLELDEEVVCPREDGLGRAIVLECVVGYEVLLVGLAVVDLEPVGGVFANYSNFLKVQRDLVLGLGCKCLNLSSKKN